LALYEIALQVRDLGSRNGTYVNGRRIGRPESVLVHGDLLAAGDITFQISIALPLQGIGSSLAGMGPSENLIPRFLSSVPRDPFADQPLCM
jgi:pSer/pThr/pTyr-binding forkhead associated (FHA) protein